MAQVYLAHDTEYHDRPVAIKLLAKALAQDSQYVSRFLDEVRTIGKLEHPAITRVYKHGEHEGQLYLVMQLLPGGELGELIDKGPLPPSQALSICKTVAGALGFAHKKGVFHRDVKPENILFDDASNPMLADFGIARDTSKLSGLTQGFVIGTPPYMSPEQMSGTELDGRSDLYSLGIVLYEMLTGKKAYRQSSFGEVLAAKTTGEPLTLPAELNTYQPLLDKFLASDSEQRYQSAEEACDAIDNLLYPASGTQSRNSVVLVAILVIALIGLGFTLYRSLGDGAPAKQTSTTTQRSNADLRAVLDTPLSVAEFHRYQDIAASKNREDAELFIKEFPNTTLSVLLELMIATPKVAQGKLEDIKRAAEAGSTGALIVLGELFTLGWADLELDPNQARVWSGRAAASGSEFGRYAFAALQLENDPSSTEAIQLLSQVAEEEFFLAQNLLGSMQLQRNGDADAQKQGFLWLEKAAAKGYREALFNLAVAHYTGTGTTLNQEKALSLFERAADLGDEQAKAILAGNSE